MSSSEKPVSINIFDQISQICRDFRKQISQGRSPRIEKYLASIPEDGRETLFSNLLEIEINFRRSIGQHPNSDEYIKRFSSYVKQIRRAFFEPTMASIDVGASTNGATQSLVELVDAVPHTVTFEIPDANRLGDYELMRELGRGGMGVVYEARHTKTDNRVALKTLPTGGQGQEVNADKLYRFRREFRRLSEINHPNLVGMQSLEVEGSQWFFTMDLIDGEDFLSFVRPNNQFDDERLRSCLKQLVKGVLELHDRGIIHRDLKPSNILVSRLGHVVVLDFGLATQLQRNGDLTQTKSGVFAGTPPYAAPEQLFGERTEASDWYAVGTMLFESLTGERPFTHADPLSLLRMKQEQDPPKLSIRKELPIDLSALTDGLLRREPELRVASNSIIESLGLENETKTTGSTRDSQSSTSSVDSDDPEFEEFDEEPVVLIGREKQLDQLEVIKQEFLATRQTSIVWVTGKSGEGKSSLIESFLRPLRQSRGILVLAGRCYDRESVPFNAIDCIIEPLVRYLRSGEGRWIKEESPEDIEFVARVFPLLRRVNWISERKIHGIERMEPQTIRGRAFYGLRQLLASIAMRSPIAIHIDDLQWGDADSALAWHELLNHEETTQLIMLGSYRSDEVDESPFLQTWTRLKSSEFHRLGSHKIEVEPLTRSQCFDLAINRTGLPKAIIEQHITELVNDTGGNPYFLDQLLHAYDPESHKLQIVPLDELVLLRLERLPRAAARLLEVVAISGQPIRISEVANIADADKTAMATITHMRSERLIRILDGGVELKVDTWHDKVRESVLGRMSTNRRVGLHLQLAELIERGLSLNADQWLENMRRSPTPGEYEVAPSDRILDLCEHFSAAKDTRAFVYQWLAGEQAMLAYAVDDAHGLFEEAANKLPLEESAILKYRFWMGLGRVSLWHKAVERTTESFNNAVALAPDYLRRAEAYAGLEAVNMQVGKYDEVARSVELALAELGIKRPRTLIGLLASFTIKNFRLFFIPYRWQAARTPKKRREARLVHHILLSSIYAYAEKNPFSWGEVVSRCSVNGLKTGEQLLVSMAYASLAMMWSVFGVGWFGRIFLKRAMRLEASTSNPESAGAYFHWCGHAEYWSGGLLNVEAQFQKAKPLLTRCCRFEDLQGCFHINRHVHGYIGNSSNELREGKAVLELATTTGNAQGMCWGAYDVAGAYARAGNVAEAVRYMQQANEALPDEPFVMTPAIRASTGGYVRLQCSDYATARRLAEYAWTIIGQGWMAIDVTLQCLPILLESIGGPDWLDRSAFNDKRSLKRAKRLTSVFYPLLPNQQPHILRVQGRAYHLLGKHRKAIKRFEKAIRLADKKGMTYQQAKCLLDLAAMVEAGREEKRREAIRLLKLTESVLPRAESWLLGDHYDESVVAPEFDLEAWEQENGAITPYLESPEVGK